MPASRKPGFSHTCPWFSLYEHRTAHSFRDEPCHAGATLTRRASERLRQTWPKLSAARSYWRSNNAVPTISFGVLTLAAAIVAPTGTTLVLETMLASVFLSWLGLRLTGVVVDSLQLTHAPRLPDTELPICTVIAALYREAASVDGLLSAIERRRTAGARRRRYIYLRRSEAASAGRRLRLNGATKRPCLSIR